MQIMKVPTIPSAPQHTQQTDRLHSDFTMWIREISPVLTWPNPPEKDAESNH